MDYTVTHSLEHVVVKHSNGWFLLDLSEGRKLGTLHDYDVYLDRSKAIDAMKDHLKYKVFESEQEAIEFSDEIQNKYGSIYNIINHPETEQAACLCPEGDVSVEEMKLRGWLL